MSMQQREPGHVSLKCFVIRKERIWFFKLRAEDKRSTFIINYAKCAKSSSVLEKKDSWREVQNRQRRSFFGLQAT